MTQGSCFGIFGIEDRATVSVRDAIAQRLISLDNLLAVFRDFKGGVTFICNASQDQNLTAIRTLTLLSIFRLPPRIMESPLFH